MLTSSVVAGSEMERDPGLTSNRSLRRSAWGRTRPPRSWFEARGAGSGATMVADLVGSGGAETGVRALGVVPGEVEGQFLLHGVETVRDRDEAMCALVLDGSDAALDHGEASVLADGAEPLLDAATATPALEFPGDELAAVVGDEVPRLHPRPPEESIEKSPHGRRGGLPREDSEAHDAPRAVVDGNREPPAERPDLRQG